jgi:FkbM family methyltransferase
MINLVRDLYHRPRLPYGNSIESLQDWLWTKEDTQCWQGPMENWLDDHQTKWFKYLKNTDVVVQAGGALGMYPRLLSDRFNLVYTFEPLFVSFFCLMENCKDKTNIIKYYAALGEFPGVCHVYMAAGDNIGATCIEYGRGNVPVMTIDSLNLPNCDLIALDVENAEREVLLGAQQTILKYYPIVIVEAGAARSYVFELLQSWGYWEAEGSAMDTIYRKY